MQFADLGANEVHLWSFDLCADQSEQSRAAELLSLDERDRAAKLRNEAQRRRFVITRGHLRRTLSLYSRGADPRAISFHYGEFGKPYLARMPHLSFNLSHSDELAVLAVTLEKPVGIDIQRIRPVARAEEMAHRFFTQQEYMAIMTFPARERLDAFFRCWTRKEACLKATGKGLALALNAFDVFPSRTHHPTSAWQLESISPGAGFAGALAIRSKERCGYRWMSAQCPQSELLP